MRKVRSIGSYLSDISGTVSSATTDYSTKIKKQVEIQKHGVAVLASLACMLLCVFVAQAAPVRNAAEKSFATALSISDGLRTIAGNAIASADRNANTQIEKDAADASENLAIAPINPPSKISAAVLNNGFKIGPLTSVAAAQAEPKKIALGTEVHIAKSVQKAAPAPAPTLRDLAINLARYEIGAVHNPRAVATALAYAEVQAYVDTGVGIYTATTNGMTAQVNLGLAWSKLSQQVLGAYSHGVYAWVYKIPEVPVAIATGEYSVGSTLADAVGTGASRTTAIAIGGEANAVNTGSKIALAVLPVGTINLAINANGKNGTHETLKSNIENTWLGALGNTGLAAVIVPTFARTVGEQTAIATYQTINGLFSNAGNQLAFLLGVTPNIRICTNRIFPRCDLGNCGNFDIYTSRQSHHLHK